MKGARCEQLNAFADGALGPADAETFRDHLASCDACAAALHERMMIEALEETHRPLQLAPAERRSEVRVLRPFRARLVRAAPVVIAPLLAAAAWLLWWRAPAPGATQTALTLEACASRSTEVRLAVAMADVHRPYDVARGAGERRHEDVPLSTLAALEARGDLHGVAAGLVLSGDDTRASTFLQRAPGTLDVLADRAALLLDEGHTREALERLDAVLEQAPGHAQALFNRGLALRDLDIPLAAAEALDAVAALGERGWADEAKQRAAALRSAFEQRQASWKQADRMGADMARGGPPPSDDVVAVMPDIARGYLYQALRTAPSRERVLALAPLASRLDTLAESHGLSGLVAHVARQDFARRAPLAATYAKIMASRSALDGPQVKAYLAALRAAHADDMLLGALQFTGTLDAHLDEYERVARSTGDAWFLAIAARSRATAQTRQGDWQAAESTLRAALAACLPAHVEWRCATVEQDLAWLLDTEARTTEARKFALSGLARARRRAPFMEPVFEYRLADIGRFEGDTTMLAAYAREVELEAPDDCGLMQATHLDLADARGAAIDPAGMVRELDATPRCNQPVVLWAADEMVDAVRMGGTPQGISSLPAELAAIRGGLPPDQQVRVDTLLARLLATTDPVAAERAAGQSLGAARKLTGADSLERIEETLARLTLAFAAADAGHADVALSALAGAVRSGDDTVAPGPCSLAVAVDGARAMAVTRDEAGQVAVELTRRAGRELSPEVIVPSGVRGRLAACPWVGVFAPPPLHGLPALLPASVAWGYVSGAPVVAMPSEARRVVVSDVRPPPELGLAPLATWSPPPRDIAWVHGADATPGRVLAQLADATEVEIDAHGLVDAARSSASVLVLSPDDAGRFTLSAADLAPGSLHGHPVVVLGACHAATTAAYLHQAWSLPSAFVRAGARATFASPDVVRDAEAQPFFDAVLARIHAGSPPAVALRDERASWLARDPGSWVASVMDFE